MKYLLTFLLFAFSLSLSAQGVIGTWKTIDDVDGTEKSNLELYMVDGKLHGKIVKLLDGADGEICIACKGDKKDKPLIGMEIIWGMKGKNGSYSGGKIMDPESGKVYKCKITLSDDKDQLDVRGYIGFSLLGRSQTWYRVN